MTRTTILETPATLRVQLLTIFPTVEASSTP
jgi:hypothetical protein